MDLKSILSSISPGDASSAIRAFNALRRADPETASIVESTLTKSALKQLNLTKLIDRLYKRLDADVPRIKFNLENSIRDSITALAAHDQCTTEWFSQLCVSPEAMRDIASVIVNRCKEFGVENPLWNDIQNGDPSTINRINQGL